jgi:hypothetical protein
MMDSHGGDNKLEANIRKTYHKEDQNRIRVKDKNDRATVD